MDDLVVIVTDIVEPKGNLWTETVYLDILRSLCPFLGSTLGYLSLGR